jgi:hypothetical protein
MWGADALWYALYVSGGERKNTMSDARRCAGIGRAARVQKRKLPDRLLDGRRYRGAKVAEIARADLCQERDNRMTTNPNNITTPVAGQRGRLPPVRVRLLRADAYKQQTCSPDGTNEHWWARLNKALGTVSPDFVKSSLLQLQAAARSPLGTISETAINAALAMIEAAAPKNEIEGAVAVQMSCTHAAAMAILGKLDSGFGAERRIALFASAAARLMKTFAMQVEVFRRLRNGGQQYVRVEHVHVMDRP